MVDLICKWGILCVIRLDYKAIHPAVIFSICTHPLNHFVLGHGHFTHRTLAKKCKMQLELYKYNLTPAFQSKLFSAKNCQRKLMVETILQLAFRED
jgi:hypothetical protein